MKNRPLAQAVALLISGLLASPVFPPLSAAPSHALLGQIVSAPAAVVSGVGIPADATLFSGDRISTGPEGWARILLAQGDQIHLDSQSTARAERRGKRIAVILKQGHLTLHTRGGNNLHVHSNGLEIEPRTAGNAVWEVTRVGEEVTLVAAHQGTLEVRSLDRTVEVFPGQSLQVRTRIVQDSDSGGRKPARIEPDDDSCRDRRAIILVLTAAAATAVMIPIIVIEGGPVSPSGFALLR